jgi:hypothetical protein
MSGSGVGKIVERSIAGVARGGRSLTRLTYAAIRDDGLKGGIYVNAWTY